MDSFITFVKEKLIQEDFSKITDVSKKEFIIAFVTNFEYAFETLHVLDILAYFHYFENVFDDRYLPSVDLLTVLTEIKILIKKRNTNIINDLDSFKKSEIAEKNAEEAIREDDIISSGMFDYLEITKLKFKECMKNMITFLDDITFKKQRFLSNPPKHGTARFYFYRIMNGCYHYTMLSKKKEAVKQLCNKPSLVTRIDEKLSIIKGDVTVSLSFITNPRLVLSLTDYDGMFITGTIAGTQINFDFDILYLFETEIMTIQKMKNDSLYSNDKISTLEQIEQSYIDKFNNFRTLDGLEIIDDLLELDMSKCIREMSFSDFYNRISTTVVQQGHIDQELQLSIVSKTMIGISVAAILFATYWFWLKPKTDSLLNTQVMIESLNKENVLNKKIMDNITTQSVTGSMAWGNCISRVSSGFHRGVMDWVLVRGLNTVFTIGIDTDNSYYTSIVLPEIVNRLIIPLGVTVLTSKFLAILLPSLFAILGPTTFAIVIVPFIASSLLSYIHNTSTETYYTGRLNQTLSHIVYSVLYYLGTHTVEQFENTANISIVKNYREITNTIIDKAEKAVYMMNYSYIEEENLTEYMAKEYCVELFRYCVMIKDTDFEKDMLSKLDKDKAEKIEKYIDNINRLRIIKMFQIDSEDKYDANLEDESGNVLTGVNLTNYNINYLFKHSNFFKKLFRSIYFNTVHKYAFTYSKDSIVSLDKEIIELAKIRTYRLYGRFFQRYETYLINDDRSNPALKAKTYYTLVEIVGAFINITNSIFQYLEVKPDEYKVFVLDYKKLLGEKNVNDTDSIDVYNNFNWVEDKREPLTKDIIDTDKEIGKSVSDAEETFEKNIIINLNPRYTNIKVFKNVLLRSIKKYYYLIHLDTTLYNIPYDEKDQNINYRRLDRLIKEVFDNLDDSKKNISKIYTHIDQEITQTVNSTLLEPEEDEQVPNPDYDLAVSLANDIKDFFNSSDFNNYLNRIPLFVLHLLMVQKIVSAQTYISSKNNIKQLLTKELAILNSVNANAIAQLSPTEQVGYSELMNMIRKIDGDFKSRRKFFAQYFVVPEQYYKNLSYNGYLFGKPNNVANYNDMYFYSLKNKNDSFKIGETVLYYNIDKPISSYVYEICNNEVFEKGIKVSGAISGEIVGSRIGKRYLFENVQEKNRDCILGSGNTLKAQYLFPSLQRNIIKFTQNLNRKFWYYYDRKINKVVLGIQGTIDECQDNLANMTNACPKYIITQSDIRAFAYSLERILDILPDDAAAYPVLNQIKNKKDTILSLKYIQLGTELRDNKVNQLYQNENYEDLPLNILYNPYTEKEKTVFLTNKDETGVDISAEEKYKLYTAEVSGEKTNISFSQFNTPYRYENDKFVATIDIGTLHGLPAPSDIAKIEELYKIYSQGKAGSVKTLIKKNILEIKNDKAEFDVLKENSMSNKDNYNIGISPISGDAAQILYESLIKGVHNQLPFDFSDVNYVGKDLLNTELFITKYMELCGNKDTDFVVNGHSMGAGYTEAFYYILWYNCIKAISDLNLGNIIRTKLEEKEIQGLQSGRGAPNCKSKYKICKNGIGNANKGLENTDIKNILKKNGYQKEQFQTLTKTELCALLKENCPEFEYDEETDAVSSSAEVASATNSISSSSAAESPVPKQASATNSISSSSAAESPVPKQASATNSISSSSAAESPVLTQASATNSISSSSAKAASSENPQRNMNEIVEFRKLIDTKVTDKKIVKRIMIAIELLLLLSKTSYIAWATPKVGTILTPIVIEKLRGIVKLDNKKETTCLNIACSIDPIQRIPWRYYHIGRTCYIHKNIYDQIRATNLTILEQANLKLNDPSFDNYKAYEFVPEYEMITQAKNFEGSIITVAETELISDEKDISGYEKINYNTKDMFEFYSNPEDIIISDNQYCLGRKHQLQTAKTLVGWAVGMFDFSNYYMERYQTKNLQYKQRGGNYSDKYKYFKNLELSTGGHTHSSYNYIYMISSLKHIGEYLNNLPELLYQTSQFIPKTEKTIAEKNVKRTFYNPLTWFGGNGLTQTDTQKETTSDDYQLKTILKIQGFIQKIKKIDDSIKQKEDSKDKLETAIKAIVKFLKSDDFTKQKSNSVKENQHKTHARTLVDELKTLEDEIKELNRQKKEIQERNSDDSVKEPFNTFNDETYLENTILNYTAILTSIENVISGKPNMETLIEANQKRLDTLFYINQKGIEYINGDLKMKNC